MPALYKAGLLLTAILLASCKTSMNRDNQGEVLSEKLGIEEDIIFLGYCEFSKVLPHEDDFEVHKGIITLTNDELTLLYGGLSNIGKDNNMITVTIEHLKGVYLAHYRKSKQLQIKRTHSLIVIQLDDQEGTGSLLQELNELGVAQYKAKTFYLFEAAKENQRLNKKKSFIDFPFWLILPLF